MTPANPASAREGLLEHQAFLRRLARSLVSDPHRAEDLAQDAAVVALERPPHGEGSIRGWLARVLRNRAIDAARSDERRSAREQGATPPVPPRTPEETEAHLQVQRRVFEAVTRLEEPYRTTILLRYYHDLGPTAIAEQLSVPVSTVKSRLARGLARLREDLDDSQPEGGRAWAVVLAGGLGEVSRPAAATALATGGIVMGVKLVVSAAAVGGALVFGGWWLLRPETGPQALAEAEVTPLAAPVELTGIGAAQLQEPTVDEDRAVLATTEPRDRPEQSAPPAAWSLTLELRGWREDDEGPVALEIRGGTEGELALSEIRELAHELSLDVGGLFAVAATRPDRLWVTLDHPAYLPTDVGVLVPQELLRPRADSGQLEATVDLVRAKAIVTGWVEVQDEAPDAPVRVAIFAMAGDQPVHEPLGSAQPDANGRFRLRADSADRHAVVAYVERAAARPRGDSNAAIALRPVTSVVALGEGEQFELEPMVLGEGEVIEGRVMLLGGKAPPSGNVLAELIHFGTWYGKELVWRDGGFETPEVKTVWDDDGHLRLTGLAPMRYRLIPSPRYPWSAERIPRIRADPSSEAEVEVSAPASNVILTLDVVQVAFGILGGGEPVAGAAVKARWDNQDGGQTTRGTRTDSLGRFEIQLDPSTGLHLEVADARWPLKEVDFTPEELTPFRVIEIHLEGEARMPATLAIRFEGDRSTLAATVVDLLLFDMDRMSDEELDRALRDTRMNISSGGVWLEPSGPRPESSAEDGLWTVSNLTPAHYTVRLTPHSEPGGPACLLLGEDFEVQLQAGERVEHPWQARLGGALRLNLTELGTLETARLLDADGNEVSANYVRTSQAPGGYSWSSVAVGPGLYDVRSPLEAGFYDLALVLEDGSTRTIPVTVEAGRVHDVVVRRDDL